MSAFATALVLGLTGWMSFPLAQDIGFDPTLNLENNELIRDGSGLVRPMRFITAANTRITVTFKSSAPLRLVLAGKDGHRYEAPIISGVPIAAPAPRNTEIQAIVIQGQTNRIVLQKFEITPEPVRDAVTLPTIGKASEHPRTLLTRHRLSQLKIQTNCPAIQTNPAAGANILKMPPGRSLRAEWDGELVPYFALLDSYANAISSCALDYAVQGNRASLDAAKRNLLAVIEWPTWTPNRFNHHGLYTYYETGLFGQKLALTYDLIAAELSPAEKLRIADAFRKLLIDPTIDEYVRYDRMPIAASNWMSNSVGGALMAAAVTQGDIEHWEEREGPALQQLAIAFQRNLRALFPGDGAEMEPLGYQHFAMEGLSWGAAALASVGIRPPELQRMYESFWWPRYAMVRPDLLLDGGDFGGSYPSFSGFAYSAEHSGIPAFRAFYDQRPKREPGLLDLACCSTQPNSSAVDAPNSRIFPDRGSAVFRSGWDADATVISLRAGPWFNHEHHDQGSYLIASRGQRIISEAGYANYYRDPNYATYFTQAPGHNTVLIDDDALSQQNSGGGFWPALDAGHLSRIASHLLSPAFDYLEADLTGAYNGRLASYTRTFLYIRPDTLIVTDDLRAPQPHVFTCLLHPPEGVKPTVDGTRARIATANIIGSSDWQLATTPLPISAFGDLNKPIPDRYVLRMNSRRTQHAEFTTTIKLQPAAPEPAILHSSTARLFVTDKDDWIAIGATKVDGRFSATAPINIAFSAAAKQYDLYLPSPAKIEIYPPGKQEPIIRSLPKGEHRVGF